MIVIEENKGKWALADGVGSTRGGGKNRIKEAGEDKKVRQNEIL